MAGLKYVGPDESTDNNAQDVVTKNDVDNEFTNAAVSQATVQAAIATAVAGYASQNYVNTALNAYAQPNFLTTEEAQLIPTSEIGVAGGVAPLGVSGVIPNAFVPDLGVGYVLGPFSATSTYAASAGAVPVKIADWSIGPPGIAFQPVVFMNMLVSATNGGRPVIEVRMSAGQAPYANQTLIARGVGRNNWNDLQAVSVLPIPAAPGANTTGFAPTYNVWLSAWLYDANAESVSIQNDNIVNASCFFIRYKQ